MLSANFKPKEQLRYRAVSLRQHGFLVPYFLTSLKSMLAVSDFQMWKIINRSRRCAMNTTISRSTTAAWVIASGKETPHAFVVGNRDLPIRFRSVWYCWSNWNICCWLSSIRCMSLCCLLSSPPSLQVSSSVVDWLSALWEDMISNSNNQPVAMVICDT